MRRFLLAACLLAGATSVVSAQAQPVVDARLGPDRSNGPNPEWRVANLFEEGRWKDALESAYSIRLEWQVKAWRKRTIADAKGPSLAYSVIIRKQPLLEEYQMITQSAGRRPVEKSFSTLDSLKVAVNAFVTVPFQLSEGGSWYYAVRLDISTLDDEELAKLQRFMNDPSTGDPIGGGAVTRGVMRLFLPTQTLNESTPTFTVRPR
ncbi:MAG: hypothetical protein V4558_02795 [Gemmatimonadota bacterium]